MLQNENKNLGSNQHTPSHSDQVLLQSSPQLL